MGILERWKNQHIELSIQNVCYSRQAYRVPTIPRPRRVVALQFIQCNHDINRTNEARSLKKMHIVPWNLIPALLTSGQVSSEYPLVGSDWTGDRSTPRPTFPNRQTKLIKLQWRRE
jgi:hypothetical protein